MADKAKVVLEINDLDIKFKMQDKKIHAIRGVDLQLKQNEILAIVGESGCGKSISAKTILGLIDTHGAVC